MGGSSEGLRVATLAYQFEVLVWLTHWKDAKKLVVKASEAGVPLKTFQKIADVACSTSTCPADGECDLEGIKEVVHPLSLQSSLFALKYALLLFTLSCVN